MLRASSSGIVSSVLIEWLPVSKAPNARSDGAERLWAEGLAHAQPDVVVVDEPQVHALLARRGHDLGRTTRDAGEHRVEVLVVHDLDAAAAQHRRRAGGRGP